MRHHTPLWWKITRRLLLVAFSLGLLAIGLYSALFAHAAAAPVQPPTNFCYGGNPWVVAAGAELPETACPDGSGKYILTIGTAREEYLTWNALRGALGGRAVTLWFEQVRQQMPTGFCNGNVAWPLPWNALMPPMGCAEGSGKYILTFGENGREEYQTWLQVLIAVGGREVTLWFERTSATMPEGFCRGGIAWEIAQNAVLPDSACGAGLGKYIATFDNVREEFDSWQKVRDGLRGRATTLWFELTGGDVLLPFRAYLPAIVRRDAVGRQGILVPANFCNGGVPIAMTVHHVLPERAICTVPGTYVFVPTTGDRIRERDWATLRRLRGSLEGSLWFEKDPEPTPTPAPTAIPTATPVPTSIVLSPRPAGFCGGTEGWAIALGAAAQLPSGDPCQGGRYAVTNETGRHDYANWAEARAALQSAAGTLWRLT